MFALVLELSSESGRITTTSIYRSIRPPESGLWLSPSVNSTGKCHPVRRPDSESKKAWLHASQQHGLTNAVKSPFEVLLLVLGRHEAISVSWLAADKANRHKSHKQKVEENNLTRRAKCPSANNCKSWQQSSGRRVRLAARESEGLHAAAALKAGGEKNCKKKAAGLKSCFFFFFFVSKTFFFSLSQKHPSGAVVIMEHKIA